MPWGPRLVEAFRLAAELHQHQLRKGRGVPYVSHLMAVAAIVAEAGGTEDEVVAALLHDGPEDQGGYATLERIARELGPEVAAIVAGCSDTFEHPKPAWGARKLAFVRGLESASPSVRLVVCADKLHNAGTLVADLRAEPRFDWSIFNGGREGTLWYYRAVLTALQPERAPAPLLDALERVVVELETRGGVGPDLSSD